MQCMALITVDYINAYSMQCMETLVETLHRNTCPLQRELRGKVIDFFMSKGNMDINVS